VRRPQSKFPVRGRGQLSKKRILVTVRIKKC